MILAADIGNSTTVLGLRSDDGSIAARWQVRTDVRSTSDEVGTLLAALAAGALPGSAPPSAACVASVVPPFTRVLTGAIERYLGIPVEPFRYAPELGLALDVDEPDRVGADRIANALAAHLAHPGPTIVVDLGTATTFDVVAADGAFLGGIIAPGLETGFEAFADRTALLPRVGPAFPTSFIGRTTVACLEIGVYGGAVVMIDGLVERIRAEWEAGARVVATGGLAALVGPRCATVDVVDPDHTLKGIGWGYDRLVPRRA